GGKRQPARRGRWGSVLVSSANSEKGNGGPRRQRAQQVVVANACAAVCRPETPGRKEENLHAPKTAPGSAAIAHSGADAAHCNPDPDSNRRSEAPAGLPSAAADRFSGECCWAWVNSTNSTRDEIPSFSKMWNM